MSHRSRADDGNAPPEPPPWHTPLTGRPGIPETWPGTRLRPLAGTLPGIKPQLTSGRRKRVTENDEYAAFARRVLRAWARRVAVGDIDAITDMATAARELDQAMHSAVNGLRAKGYSWAEIAARLGVTRQAAQQRWGGSAPGARQGHG